MSAAKWFLVSVALVSILGEAVAAERSFRIRKSLCSIMDDADCAAWVNQLAGGEDLSLPEEPEVDYPLEVAGISGDALAMNIEGGVSPGTPVVFTITNDGSEETGTISVSITGNTDNFSKTGDTCHGTTLAVGEECDITIEPVATENGVYSATLVVSASPGGSATQPLFSQVSGFAGGYSGGLYAWGANSRGELGDGTTTSRSTPALVSGMASGVIGIPEAGGEQGCALYDGSLKCWGSNNYGQVGDGTTTNRVVPVQVVGMESGVTAVDGGQLYHTCAIQNGAAKCWGQGYGTTPQQVVGLESGVTAIGAGRNQTCAVQNGAVKCWGGSYGATPVQISGLTGGATAVDAGYSFACAIQSGAVKCWGQNSSGQLGNGTTTGSTAAVQVSGLTGGVSSITLGLDYACALHNNVPRCWGENGSGQLGDGTNTDRTTPIQVSGLASGVTVIDAGYYHTCAIQNGAVKCWGHSASGGSGVGFTNIPTQVPGMEAGVVDISAGNLHTVALLAASTTDYNFLSAAVASGDALAMNITDGTSPGAPVTFTITNDGDGETGILSVSITGNEDNFSKTADTCNGSTIAIGASCSITVVPVATANGIYSASLVVGSTPGGSVSHAMMSQVSGFPGEFVGGLYAWGANTRGELGDGTTTTRHMPALVSGMDVGVVGIPEAGGEQSCALQNGALKCWGSNNNGQIGDGTIINRVVPVQVSGMGGGVTAVDGGMYYHTCAVQNGAAKCWGRNAYGELGDGTTTGRRVPTQVLGLTSGVTAIGVGRWDSCAVQSGGVKCWGGSRGIMGPTQTYGTTPLQISGLESGVTAVDVGGSFACVIQNGAAKCWGRNSSGQLGDGTTTGRTSPVQVSGLASGVTAISLGMDYACVLHNNVPKCWGGNGYGQLGDGTISTRTTPVQVSGLSSGVTAIDAGYWHTCAIQNGAGKCWGRLNPSQQPHVPTQVSGMENGVTAISAGNQHTVALLAGSGSSGPSGYWVAFDEGELNLANEGSVSFTILGATVGATYSWSIDDTGNPGTTPITGTGTIAGATQQFAGINVSALDDGMVTVAVTLESGGHAGMEMTDVVTKDTVAPSVSTLFPTDNSVDVALDANLVLTFGDNIAKGSGNIVIYNAGGTVFETIAVTDAKVSVSGNQATVNSAGTFAPGAGYYVTVTAGAFVDESGNPHAGIAGSSTWNFSAVLADPALSIDPLSASGMDVNGGGAPAGTMQYGASVAFMVSNCVGCRATTALSTDLSGGNFEVVSNGCAAPLGTGASCIVSVRPLADNNIASYTGTLSVSAAEGGTVLASLSGVSSGFGASLPSGTYGWGLLRYTGLPTANVPTELAGIGAGVTLVEAGGATYCIIQGGALKCWGYNGYGALGDGTWVDSDVPVQVQGMESGVSAVDGGQLYHTCAIQNGAAKCWGHNGYGELGDGSAVTSNVPVQVSGLDSGVTAIGAGRDRTCAAHNGAAKCWGLGFGSTPVQVSGLESNVTALASGESFSCAIQGGAAKCWGSNVYGQLGNGTNIDSSAAVQVSGLTSGVTAITTSLNSACAIHNGALVCWGSNSSGELGDGSGISSNVPVQVLGMGSNVTAVSAGYSHICAIRSGGMKCWGDSWSGCLGDGTGAGSWVPVQPVGMESGVIFISAGNEYTLAIK